MTQLTPSPADIAELEQLTQQIIEEGGSWTPDNSPYNFWLQRVRNLIVRCYANSGRRLNELDQEADYRRTSLVTSWGKGRVDSSITKLVEFRENIPKLKSYVSALLFDLKQRASVAGVPGGSIPARPLVFIAHGGHSEERDGLELFLWRAGYRPIIVEELPTLGKSPGEKVDYYMGKCQFGVIFAEISRAAAQNGKLYPRLNIIDEMVRIQKILDNKFIVLLEKGLTLNSDQQVTWEPFDKDNIAKAYNAMLRELKTHGIQGSDELDRL